MDRKWIENGLIDEWFGDVVNLLYNMTIFVIVSKIPDYSLISSNSNLLMQ